MTGSPREPLDPRADLSDHRGEQRLAAAPERVARQVARALGFVQLVPPQVHRRKRHVRDGDVRDLGPAAPLGQLDRGAGPAVRVDEPALTRVDGRQVALGDEQHEVVAELEREAGGRLQVLERLLEVVRPELRDAEVRQRERAHLDRDGAVPALVEREPRSAERLGHVAHQPCAVERGGRGRHREAPLPFGGELVGELVRPDEQLIGSLDLAGLEQQPRHRQRELGIRVHDLGGDLRRELAQNRRPSRAPRTTSHCAPTISAASCQSEAATACRTASTRLPMSREPGARRSCAAPGARPGADAAAPRGAPRRTAGGSGTRCRSSRAPPRNHRLVRAAQRVLAGSNAGERACELAVQPIDDRRTEQELQRLLVVAADHLGHQVVADRAVVAGEACDECARVGMVPERELREPEPRGPAL